MDTTNKTFHFIAIGGVGQSALAKILAVKGYKVSGSDMSDSKYTKELKSLGVDVCIGHDEKNINENQIIVLSTAIKEDNVELKKARQLGLPIYHRSDILKFISDNYPCFIGFSGTHGKTTTSGLCSFLLEKINAHPAYASGGIISGLNTNANAYPDSKIFVAELDESDGTIIKYNPDYIVVNNLEPDHFDFYKNGEEDLINQFLKFASNLKKSAKIFINIDDAGNVKFKNLIQNNVITYSMKDKTADYYAGEIKLEEDFNLFNLYKNGEFISEIKTSLKGAHNVINALSVISVLLEAGFKIKDFIDYIFEFSGMKRRFEKVFENDIVRIYDDYAHHPTEIKAALSAARKQAKGELKVVFQPHRYTRLKALWKEFLTSFDLADELFIVDTFSAGDKFDDKFNSENFAREIKNCTYVKGNMEEAAKEIFKHINKGDFLITVGAGDVTKIGYNLEKQYETNGN